MQAADHYGMRFIGPNCIGVICTEAKLSVPFPLLDRSIMPGGLSILAQSARHRPHLSARMLREPGGGG